MGYDITLNDPVTKETIEFDAPHQIQGGHIPQMEQQRLG